MALKPTIYKCNIALNDFNNDHFTQLNLVLAQHPSETLERMLTRILAFCLHSFENTDNTLAFTKGLSAVEEPDIWQKSLDDQIQLWLDVGEPAFERLKKASRLAKQSYVYSFNAKSAVWWKQNQQQFSQLPLVVAQFDWSAIQRLAGFVARTMDWTVNLSDNNALVVLQEQQIEIPWQYLQKLA